MSDENLNIVTLTPYRRSANAFIRSSDFIDDRHVNILLFDYSKGVTYDMGRIHHMEPITIRK